MARKPERKPDDPEQSKRFVDAAKEAGADETEAGADRAFKKIMRPSQPSQSDRPRKQDTAKEGGRTGQR